MEKAAFDAKCKKVSNLINENSKKRIALVERESHLVFRYSYIFLFLRSQFFCFSHSLLHNWKFLFPFHY